MCRKGTATFILVMFKAPYRIPLFGYLGFDIAFLDTLHKLQTRCIGYAASGRFSMLRVEHQ